MVCALVCMVTHWIGPMMSHNLRLSSSHDVDPHLSRALPLDRHTRFYLFVTN